MSQIKKIAELAFHENTEEAVAIVAFLKLRRSGLTELKDALGAVIQPTPQVGEQTSSWKIAGPNDFIGRNAYYGCLLMESIDGKCHIKPNKKAIFGRQKYTITLKYSNAYSRADVELQFARLTS